MCSAVPGFVPGSRSETAQNHPTPPNRQNKNPPKRLTFSEGSGALSGLTVQCANQAAPRARIGTPRGYTTPFRYARSDCALDCARQLPSNLLEIRRTHDVVAIEQGPHPVPRHPHRDALGDARGRAITTVAIALSVSPAREGRVLISCPDACYGSRPGPVDILESP